MGFIVEVFTDLTKDELLYEMQRASNQSYKHYRAFIFVILTHGDGEELWATDAPLHIQDITQPFKNSTKLDGIPKVFFIEEGRCMGDSPEYIAHSGTFPETTFRVDQSECVEKTVKLDLSDFLLVCSTVSGHNSWLNPIGGSWFVQALCMVLGAHARDMDLVRMLVKVNELVSRQQCSLLGDGQEAIYNGRQVASVVSQLRKELYFFPPTMSR